MDYIEFNTETMLEDTTTIFTQQRVGTPPQAQSDKKKDADVGAISALFIIAIIYFIYKFIKIKQNDKV